MQEHVAQEDIRGYFQDVKDLFKETSVKFQETERLLKEKSQETEKLLKEKSLETEQKFQETDRKFQESDRKFQESNKEFDRRMKLLDRKLGSLTDRLGEFVEEMVKPAVVRLFSDRGIKVHQVMKNVEGFDDKGAFEIDLLVVNEDELVVVACKSKIVIKDIDEHISRIGKFKRISHQYKGYRILGAVAGMVISDEASMYAYKKGFFVLCQSGESIEIRNDQKFKPKVW